MAKAELRELTKKEKTEYWLEKISDAPKYYLGTDFPSEEDVRKCAEKLAKESEIKLPVLIGEEEG